MTNLNLPAWLDWLGSPAVCTIVTVVGIITTLLSIFFGAQYFRLKLQIQTAQGGPQQQGQGAQQQQQGGPGAQQQQQANTGQFGGDAVTINYYGDVHFHTETKGED